LYRPWVARQIQWLTEAQAAASRQIQWLTEAQARTAKAIHELTAVQHATARGRPAAGSPAGVFIAGFLGPYLECGMPGPRADSSEEQPTIFRGLPPEEVAELLRRSRIRRTHDGETLFGEGDPPGPVFVVRTGSIKLTLISEGGQETVLALAYPGDVVGEMSALDDRPRSANAVVSEAGEVGVLAREDFLGYLRQSAPACFRLLRLLVARLRATDQHVADLVFADLQARVARMLLRLCNHQPTTLQFTQEELAQMVGCSRQRLNQVLRHYQDQGYLALAPHRISVKDPDGLHAEALL
jgi:CRP-like cAMP-binding protein